MGRRKNHLAVKADLVLHGFRQRPCHGSRHGQPGKQFFRISELTNQLIVPRLRHRTDQLGGRRVGIFLSLHAGQHIMKVIRDHQQGLRTGKCLRLFLFHRHQLIDGVEYLLLDSSPFIQGLRRNDFVYLFVHALCPVIPVADCVSQPLSVSVQQDKIHRPGVDSHTARNLSQRRALLHSHLDLVKQGFHIPAEMAVSFHHAVFKTVDLFQTNCSVLHCAEDMTAAGCANVHCKVIVLHLYHPPIFSNHILSNYQAEKKVSVY